MTAVDIAERKGRWRAIGFLSLAALTVAVTVAATTGGSGDFIQGLWFGLIVGSALNLLPIKRWLRPNDAVIRLLEDEGVRENRRLSCTAGFWAAMISVIALVLASRFTGAVSKHGFGQLVATAGMVSAMVTFGILELRAAR